MKPSSLFFPLLLIVSGSLWLLGDTFRLPPTPFLVAAVLAGCGLFTLIADGINKQSLFYGPMLMYAAAAVLLDNYHIMQRSSLTALAMVLAGCLLILTRSTLVPPKYGRHGLPYRRRDGGQPE